MQEEQNLKKLLAIKKKLENLTEEELVGSKANQLLSELRNILNGLQSSAVVDRDRLLNITTFVNNRRELDFMVRRVLLGLIGNLANNPTVQEKPAPDINGLLGKIPGLEQALKKASTFENQGQKSSQGDSAKPVKLTQTKEPIPTKAASTVGTVQPDKGSDSSTQGKAVPEVNGSDAPDVASLATEASSEIAAATAEESVTFNTRELVGFFLHDSVEQVETFTDGLLSLEKDGASPKLVNELFRTAHTLKGSAGTMGYTTIVKITHRAEDVLDRLRQGKNRVSPELVDTLLDTADRVKSILGDIQNGGEGTLAVEDIVERLETYLGKPNRVKPIPPVTKPLDLGTPVVKLDQKTSVATGQESPRTRSMASEPVAKSTTVSYQENLTKLSEIKKQLENLAQGELTGNKVQGLLSELQNILQVLHNNPEVDHDRLSNITTFVSNRKELDTVVRRVLLGLIGNLVNNPAVQVKPTPDISGLVGKIPGLGEALKKVVVVDADNRIPSQVPSKKSAKPTQDKEQITPVKPLKPNVKGESVQQDLPDTQISSSTKPASATTSDPTTKATVATAAGVDSAPKNPTFNTRELLGFYLQDSAEEVEKFANGLLNLEKDGANSELVNELFRTAHTLKGAAGTMGFVAIVRITHLAEDVLDRLRQGKSQVSPELVDTLLGVADRVKSILAEIQNGGEGALNVDDLIERLEICLGKRKTVISAPPAATPDAETPVFELDEKGFTTVKEMRQSGLKVFVTTVKFSSSIIMPSVRAVMAMRRVEKYCKVLQTKPSALELRKDKHPEFHLLLATEEDITIVEKAILQVAEITGVSSVLFEAEEIPVQVINVADVVRRQTQETEFVSAESNDKPDPEVTSRPFKNQTIRVQTERLDDLLNLVGELVVTRTRLVTVGSQLKEVNPHEPLLNSLNETSVYLGRLMNELQESVMAMRMVPIGQVFSRFPRLIRDLARKTGKEVELVCYGEETGLDKTIIEEIGNPLTHIIRNAIDHGIETVSERERKGKVPYGKITIHASHEASHIIIVISDDGRGINLNAVKEKALAKGLINPGLDLNDKDLVNLIFLPGLSTASQVTDLSGRGVGMDAVKKSLVNLGGMVDIDTSLDQGTTFTIRLPLTLAIIHALMVEVNSETYAIPLASVLETLRVRKQEIASVNGHSIIQLRDSTLQLVSLRKHFGLDTSVTLEENDIVHVVVVGFGEKRVGVMVDALIGQQEVVIKPLGEFLANLTGFSGATIQGDGKVTLILDVGSLIHDSLVNRV